MMSMDDNDKIWNVGTLNVQAGLATNSYRDYITKSWHHLSPTVNSKSKNLSIFANQISHLDVFGVQELDVGSIRSGFLNQASFMAKSCDFPHFLHQINRKTGFTVTANALMSRWDIEGYEKWTLPSRKSQNAPRGAVCGYFTDPNGKQWCAVVAHLSLNSACRQKQCDFLMDRLSDEKSFILMGDFNAEPYSKELSSMRRLMDGHTEMKTYPRWKPIKNIDTIWWKGLDIIDQKSNCWGVTDHRGVEISFKLPK